MVGTAAEDHPGAMETDQETTAPPSHPPPPGGRLRRDPNGKIVAGVCSGLGRHFGIDPVIFRIGFAALTLAGAAGVVIYLLAWLFVPEDGQEVAKGTAMLSDRRITRRTTAWVLAGIALLVLLNDWNDRPDKGGVVAALILGGAAVALFSSRSGGDPPTRWSPPHPAGPPPEPGPESESGPAAEAGPTTTATLPLLTAPAEPPAPRPPRSPLGRITLSVLSILGGLLLLLDRTGGADVALSSYLALALLVVGGALVLATWWGRSRGLLVVGILLAGAAATTALIDVPLGAGIGERTYRPAGVADLRPAYRLAVGDLTLDLREVAPAPGTTEVIDARVGLGRVVVVVPDDARVVVHGRVRAGELDVLGRTDEGTNVRNRIDVPALYEGGGTLDLRVSAGAGEVEVVR